MIELGMVTDVSPESTKARLPIEVTELGKVMEVNSEQPAKALSPMEVTEYVVSSYVIVSGIIISPVYVLCVYS